MARATKCCPRRLLWQVRARLTKLQDAMPTRESRATADVGSSKGSAKWSARSARTKLKALLFDFGGTLAFLDFELLAREFSREGRKLEPLALEHAEYAGRAAIDRHLMSAGNAKRHCSRLRAFFRGWMTAAGIPEEEFQEHARAGFARYIARPRCGASCGRARSRRSSAFKSAGYKLAIVSNAEGQVAADAQRFGLAPYFDVIIDSHVVGVAKPDPRIFQIALERLGVGPDEVRFAGDIYSIDVRRRARRRNRGAADRSASSAILGRSREDSAHRRAASDRLSRSEDPYGRD